MIAADATKKDPDTHWLLPAMATKVFHAPLAADASLELIVEMRTTIPSARIIKPQASTYTLRPARKKFMAVPTVFALNLPNALLNDPAISNSVIYERSSRGNRG